MEEEAPAAAVAAAESIEEGDCTSAAAEKPAEAKAPVENPVKGIPAAAAADGGAPPEAAAVFSVHAAAAGSHTEAA